MKLISISLWTNHSSSLVSLWESKYSCSYWKFGVQSLASVTQLYGNVSQFHHEDTLWFERGREDTVCLYLCSSRGPVQSIPRAPGGSMVQREKWSRSELQASVSQRNLTCLIQSWDVSERDTVVLSLVTKQMIGDLTILDQRESCVYIHVCTFLACARACVYVCVCARVCMHVCLWTGICVYLCGRYVFLCTHSD